MARPFHFRRTMRVEWGRAVSACTVALLLWIAGCQKESSALNEEDSVAMVADDDRAGCGIPHGDVQIDGGVGVLRPGARVSELRARCRVLRDTTMLGIEGMPVRTVVVALGADSAVAEIQNDSVWRVRLTSDRFLGDGGMRIGTPARRLAAMAGAGAYAGEGEVYVMVPSQCGVSYRLSGADLGRIASAGSAEDALRSIPESARVDLILLYGCERDAGPSGFHRADPMPHRRVPAGVMS